MRALTLTVGSFFVNGKGDTIVIAGAVDPTNPLYARGYRFFDQKLVNYTETGRHQSFWRRYDLLTELNNDDVGLIGGLELLVEANTNVGKHVRRKALNHKIKTAYAVVYLTSVIATTAAAAIKAQRAKQAQ